MAITVDTMHGVQDPAARFVQLIRHRLTCIANDRITVQLTQEIRVCHPITNQACVISSVHCQPLCAIVVFQFPREWIKMKWKQHSCEQASSVAMGVRERCALKFWKKWVQNYTFPIISFRNQAEAFSKRVTRTLSGHRKQKAKVLSVEMIERGLCWEWWRLALTKDHVMCFVWNLNLDRASI